MANNSLRGMFLVIVATLVALALGYQVRSRIFVEVGSPRDTFFLDNFFDPEGTAPQTYRWTRATSRIVLAGQQLATPWTLAVRLNGYRPTRSARVRVSVNGVLAQTLQTTSDWAVYQIQNDAPGDIWTGATVLDFATGSFVPHNADPNNSDTRSLGVAIDWLEWTPLRSSAAVGNNDFWIDLGRAPILPPLGIVLSWAGAFGLVYLTARRIGLPARPVNLLFGVGIILLALGIALARPYVATYTAGFLLLALALTVLAVILQWLVPRLASYFAISLNEYERALLCGIVLLSIGLKWGGAWYPQFRSSDLLFHAHRLAYVSQGNLFFTSELPDAAHRVVPYPPALYVTLLPFIPFTTAYENLLLISNVLFEAIAILAIYFTARKLANRQAPIANRQAQIANRQSQIANRESPIAQSPNLSLPPSQSLISNLQSPVSNSFALFAAFLFAFNPVTFWIYSWGNHTNIFGQTIATLLFCLLLTQPLTYPKETQVRFRLTPYFFLALFFLLLGSAAHLGIFLSLLAFSPIVIVWRFFAGDTNAKRESVALLILFLLNLLLVWLVYYAEFTALLLAQTQQFITDASAGQATKNGITLQRISNVLLEPAAQVGWVLLLGGIAGIPLVWSKWSVSARPIWGAWVLVGFLFGLVTIASSFSTRYPLWAAPALALSGGMLFAWSFQRTRRAQFVVYALCAFALAQTLWLWIDRVLNAYQ